MLYHNTIRKYTSALLDLFNDIQLPFIKSDGTEHFKAIPIVFSTREKCVSFDEKTTEALYSGNYNVLPRASLSLNSMAKNGGRIMNKNQKINKARTEKTIDFSFNSVPYDFSYDLIIQCRGMNQTSLILETILPMFNPTINIDIFDAVNLSEATRVPVKLEGVEFSGDDYDELSANIYQITISLSLVGNIYSPIKTQARVEEYDMNINEIIGDEYFKTKTIMEWDVDNEGELNNLVRTDVDYPQK